MVAAPILPVRLEGVSVTRGDKRLIGPLSLTLGEAPITVVMGPNGAGKTTLMRALHGLERRIAGRIIWSGPDARRHQAFVFQQTVVLRRSVLDNIAYPLRLDGVPRAEARARATRAAATTGLSSMLDRDATRLSGGERAKLAIARARIRAPQLLILDEPSASLDPRSTAEIEEMLRAARKAGLRIIMSSHSIAQARRLADEIVFLHDGLVCDQTPAAEFFAGAQSRVAQAYLNGELIP